MNILDIGTPHNILYYGLPIQIYTVDI